MDAKKADRISELEEIITSLDTAYEVGDDCLNPKTGKIVTDGEYDALRKELEQLCPSSDVLKSVTASKIQASTDKVIHNPSMTSISKSCGSLNERNKILADWLKKCSDELGYKGTYNKDNTPFFSQSLKHDGVAIALYYEDGKLVRSGLRPRDGIHGEGVFENSKYVEGIPATLPLPITCSIRGELECKISTFEKLNVDAEKNGEQVFANPRNYTAGSIRQFKDPKETAKRQISFTAYNIENLENPPYKTEIERAIWCNKVLKIPYVRTEPFNYKDLQKLEDLAKTLDYETDGVVLSVNILEDQEQLGRHGNSDIGSPKGKLAWKFSEQSATPIVKSIRWQTGRTGKLTPVIEFDAVKLAGTMVRQCTAHNVGIVKNKKIGIGAKVRIIKSGKIIPKIIDVISPSTNFSVPTICPSCQSKLVEEKNDKDGTSELFCENTYDCPAQNIGNLVNYLSVIDAKGVAEASVAKMTEAGIVKKIVDFYELNDKDLLVAGFTKRQALLIRAAVWMIDAPEKYDDEELEKVIDKTPKKIKLSVSKLIPALGISGASKGTGRVLADHFNSDFDLIRSAKEDELMGISEIGPITSKSLVDYFLEQKNNLDTLMKYIEIEVPKKGKLTGQTFVFTGASSKPRKELEKLVEDNGGKTSSSVSKSTTFVVSGESSGSKLDKAKKLGIKVIDEDEFMKKVK
jgi:DNA ligase (NAD+)